MDEDQDNFDDWDSNDDVEGRRLRFRRWVKGIPARVSTIEARYLSILRYSMLVLASILLVGAIALIVMGGAKQIGPSAVKPDEVKVSPADIAPAAIEEVISPAKAQDKAYEISDQLKSKTLSVYKLRFANFHRSGETITDKMILDTVWPEDRRRAFDNTDVDYVDEEGTAYPAGEELALHALDLVAKSAVTPDFQKSLKTYRAAKKSKVCRDETRSRKRTVSYWDSLSQACDNWYYSPYGCSATRTVAEPYTEQVCKMQFPEDLDSPAVAMGNAVDRFLMVAATRQDSAYYEAEEKTARINERKVTGRANMLDGGKVFLGFLGLMFLYLLVVMERHHRLLRSLVPSPEE